MSAVLFAHHNAHVLRSLKPQGLRVRIPLESKLFLNLPIFKIQLNSC